MLQTTIAIIEATGDPGSAIATGLATSGYRLLLFAHQRKDLQSLARAIKSKVPGADIVPVFCAAEATWEADIIISTVQLNNNKQIVKKIESHSNRKILIDASKSERHFSSLLGAVRKTEQLQTLLPGAKIVSLFNTPFGDDKEKRSGLLVGGDQESLETVKRIFENAQHRTVRLIDYKNYFKKNYQKQK